MTTKPHFQRKVEAHKNLPTPAMRKAIRVDAGLSQDDLGAEVGVSRAAISRWESGLRSPRGDNLVAYFEALRTAQGA